MYVRYVVLFSANIHASLTNIEAELHLDILVDM